ncbi:DNA topoisomerase IB [Afifella aestuarii]|uniref:DNA topoisomerase IB n=1 Tax=Afifella aestuarii TaxID=1909496 RepID=UPI000FE392F0|nr:DNA topoisomerase IB [Afifella aestuarii]
MADTLQERAELCGLNYICAENLKIERRRSGRGFTYRCDGKTIRDRRLRRRLEDLVIPPAWTSVCIAEDPHAHLQAVGRDQEGRLQYRYHEDWTEVRNAIKAERLLRFGRALPKIRERIARDLDRRRTDRRFSAAVAARLVDRALLRSGHRGEPSDGEGARGATTLLKKDVRLNGRTVTLDFTGKSGKKIHKVIPDTYLPSRLRKLKAIGKRRLFAYRESDGSRAYLNARDLNQYLKNAAGAQVTSKDFRTFAASAAALELFVTSEKPESEVARKRAIASVMREVSDKLANTMAVCRSSYVHPLVVQAFQEERLRADLLRGPHRTHLSAAETALMRFLEAEEASMKAEHEPAAGR